MNHPDCSRCSPPSIHRHPPPPLANFQDDEVCPIWMDVDSYASRKSLAQGLLDVALMSANGTQLKRTITLPEPRPLDYLLLTLVIASLSLQLIQALLVLFLGAKCNINKTKYHFRAVIVNNVILGLTLVIVAINVFIAAFGLSD